MQAVVTEDPKSRQVYVSALGKNLLREAFLGNTDFTYKQQSVFHPTTPQTKVNCYYIIISSQYVDCTKCIETSRIKENSAGYSHLCSV